MKNLFPSRVFGIWKLSASLSIVHVVKTWFWYSLRRTLGLLAEVCLSCTPKPTVQSSILSAKSPKELVLPRFEVTLFPYGSRKSGL